MPDQLMPLRVIAALTAGCGLAALAVTGLLSPVAAVGIAVVMVLVSYACSVDPSDRGRSFRKHLGYVVLTAVLVYVASRLAGPRDPAMLTRVLPPLLIGVLIAQSLGADKRHDLMVSVTVGEFMIVLTAGISPVPMLTIPLIAGWALGLAALSQSHHLHVADCSTPSLRTNAPHRPSLLPAAATATVIAMIAGLVLFLILPRPSETAAQRRLRNAVRTDQSIAGGGRAGDHYSDGALDMRTRGDLGNRPVAEVPADSSPLWRSRVYQSYDGIHWKGDETAPLLVGEGRVTLPADPLDEGVLPPGRRRTDDVRAREGFSGLVIAPGTPVALMTSGRVGVAGAARIVIEQGNYAVTSIEPETDPGTLASAQGADPSEAWLQLPAALPGRIEALAREITSSAPSRPAKVEAISRYLQANKRYDLNSPVPPPGADAVDDFLFRVDTGFCEQFAAAEVVLLRTLGIPARMATGYGYGTKQGDGSRLFTSADAHAWVEVWYPGLGWSPADPTPEALPSTSSKNVFARLVAWVQRALATTRGRLALAAIIAIISAIGFAVAWLRRRRTAFEAPFQPVAPLANSLITAFTRLEAALQTDDRPRAPGETLAELSRRLGTDPAGRRALEIFEQAVYAPQSVTPEDARAAAHSFEQLASSILAANAARAQLADSIGVRR